MAVVQGKSVFARVYQPGQFGYYFIKLAVDRDTAKALKAEGVSVRAASGDPLPDGTSEKDFGPYIAQFKENEQPRVVDADMEPFDKLIGNGSLVNVQYRVGSWNFKGKAGKTGYLKAVQVVEHIPYVKVDEDGNEVEIERGGNALEFKPVKAAKGQAKQAKATDPDPDFDDEDLPF